MLTSPSKVSCSVLFCFYHFLFPLWCARCSLPLTTKCVVKVFIFVNMVGNATNIFLTCISLTMHEIKHPFLYLSTRHIHFSMSFCSCVLHIFQSDVWSLIFLELFRRINSLSQSCKNVVPVCFPFWICLWCFLACRLSFEFLCNDPISIFFYCFWILSTRKSIFHLVYKEIHPYFFLACFLVFTFRS